MGPFFELAVPSQLVFFELAVPSQLGFFQLRLFPLFFPRFRLPKKKVERTKTAVPPTHFLRF